LYLDESGKWMKSLFLKILHIDMLFWKLHTIKLGKLKDSNLNIFDPVCYGKDRFLILRRQACNGSSFKTGFSF
jgi:hypothetical protein